MKFEENYDKSEHSPKFEFNLSDFRNIFSKGVVKPKSNSKNPYPTTNDHYYSREKMKGIQILKSRGNRSIHLMESQISIV